MTIPQIKKLALPCIFVFALIFTGCSDDPASSDGGNETPDEFVTVSTYESGQYQYTVYAMDTLRTGHNEVYIAVENDMDEMVSIQNPVISPIMHMSDMNHAAPVSDTEIAEIQGRSYLKADVYFIMPSMGDENWGLKVMGEADGGTAIDEEITVEVEGGGIMTSKKVGDRTYYLSYVKPKVPVVGGDSYMVAVHYMENMMNFPAVTNATVKLDPYMDMGGGEGHGPTSYDEMATEQRAGMYEGDIVYNMAGEWQLTFTATLDDGTEIPFSVLEITVDQ